VRYYYHDKQYQPFISKGYYYFYSCFFHFCALKNPNGYGHARAMEATRKYLAIIFPNHQYSPEFPSFPNTISRNARHQAPRLQERTEKLRKCPSLRFNKQISYTPYKQIIEKTYNISWLVLLILTFL
jgi:hypothetical protein